MLTKRSRKTSKRTLIQPPKGDRRYVRRNKAGQFKKEVNVGRLLATDRRRKAKTKMAKGQGDRGGDTKRSSGNAVKSWDTHCNCALSLSAMKLASIFHRSIMAETFVEVSRSLAYEEGRPPDGSA